MLDLTTLDEAHLGALSRALHEARFCRESNDPVVWASHLVVDLHVWVLLEQRKRDEGAERRSDWASWLRWAGRDEEKTVVQRLREDTTFLDIVADAPDLLRDILRPFVVTDDSLDAIITAARLPG